MLHQHPAAAGAAAQHPGGDGNSLVLAVLQKLPVRLFCHSSLHEPSDTTTKIKLLILTGMGSQMGFEMRRFAINFATAFVLATVRF